MIHKKFDKSNLKLIRLSIEEALATVELNHGIKLSLGSITYTDEAFSGKLKAFIANPKTAPRLSDPKAAQKLEYANNVRKHGWKMGISEADLGKIVTMRNRGEVEFVGCKDRDSKMPLIFEDENGQLIRAAKSYLPKG
jgi:hypothetical protein